MNQSHIGLSLPSHPPTRTNSLTFLLTLYVTGDARVRARKDTHPLKVMDVWRHQ